MRSWVGKVQIDTNAMSPTRPDVEIGNLEGTLGPTVF